MHACMIPYPGMQTRTQTGIGLTCAIAHPDACSEVRGRGDGVRCNMRGRLSPLLCLLLLERHSERICFQRPGQGRLPLLKSVNSKVRVQRLSCWVRRPWGNRTRWLEFSSVRRTPEPGMARAGGEQRKRGKEGEEEEEAAEATGRRVDGKTKLRSHLPASDAASWTRHQQTHTRHGRD